MKNRTWNRWRIHFLFHRYIVTMGELRTSGSAAKPDHIPMLEERVNTLSNQVILLISHFWDSANKSVEMAVPSACHGFVNPHGYMGVGKPGTGMGHAWDTCPKPTPVWRVWRVFSVWLVLIKVSSNSDQTLIIDWYSTSRQSHTASTTPASLPCARSSFTAPVYFVFHLVLVFTD